MKIKFTFVLTLLLNIAFGQNSDDKTNKEQYKELKKSAQFYELDNRNAVQSDTVFVALSGFWFKELFRTKIKEARYVVIEYPPYKKTSTNSTFSNSEIKNTDSPVYKIMDTTTNNKRLCMEVSEFEKLETMPIYYKRCDITGGVLTAPFKIRPAVNSTPFSMTTDVTIGSYVGLRFRVSKRDDLFLTIPISIGLTFINVNTNTTTLTNPETNASIVPGVGGGSGCILQYGKFEFGILVGSDYATGSLGDKWIYNKKLWYSFALGYSFLK